MLLKRVPAISNQLQIKDMIRIFVFFMLFLLVLMLLPWRPKYSVEGILKGWPDVVMVRASQEGIIRHSDLQLGQKVYQGQVLFKLIPVSYLVAEKVSQFKYKNLKFILENLVSEKHYQKNRLNQLQRLLKNKSITHEFFHQIESELRNKEIEYRKVLVQLKHLKQKQGHLIQAPISGKIVSLEIKNSKMIKKNQVLFAIQPAVKRWEVLLKVPLVYKFYLNQDSLFKLSLPSNSKIKRYDISAKLINISEVVMHHSKRDYLSVHAQILNTTCLENKFIPNMPLNGFLLGPQFKVFQWIVRFISNH